MSLSKEIYSLKDKKVYVAGHNGMVGSACVRALKKESCKILTPKRDSLDLISQAQVELWMKKNRPDVVIICAAKVGGILANNSYPAEFLYNNIQIENNLIHASFKYGVEKLLFLGSSCIYPKFSKQPIKEEYLLTGSLEETNEWYAIAKIAGIKLCQAYRKQYNCNYISAMPTNLYGPGDNYDLKTSHVIPALLKKCIDAKKLDKEYLEVWGSGMAKREFMHVDDCASGIIFLLKHYSDYSHVNLGTGMDITIKELASIISKVVKFKGDLKFDKSKPDGTPRKLLDTTKINNMGWYPKIDLKEGLMECVNIITNE